MQYLYLNKDFDDIDDYYEVNYPGLNQYELKIDVYSDLFKLISKKKIFPELLNCEFDFEKIILINRKHLFNILN